MSGFTCATCAEKVSVDTFAPWRCPNEKGDRHHVLLIDVNDQHVVENHHNPFIAFRRNMMWWQFAQARGMSDERAMALVQSVDDEIVKIGGACCSDAGSASLQLARSYPGAVPGRSDRVLQC